MKVEEYLQQSGRPETDKVTFADLRALIDESAQTPEEPKKEEPAPAAPEPPAT